MDVRTGEQWTLLTAGIGKLQAIGGLLIIGMVFLLGAFMIACWYRDLKLMGAEILAALFLMAVIGRVSRLLNLLRGKKS